MGDGGYVYFSGQRSPRGRAEASSCAKSEAKKGSREMKDSESHEKIQFRSGQSRGRPREGRCWKSQAQVVDHGKVDNQFATRLAKARSATAATVTGRLSP